MSALSANNPHRSSTGPEAGTVYVVDDDPTILEVTKTLLEIHGYHVLAFQSPLAALDAFLAAKPRPRLLLTDYVMPEMNGMELIDRCREVEPDLRSVMMSGSVGEDIFRGVESRPDQFLRKPFLSKQLVASTQAALD